MSTRNDITSTPPRLAYSCRCGWLDLGHMNPTSHRTGEGAQSLWEQVNKESGPRSETSADGFKVAYKQTHGKKILGHVVRDGVGQAYWVKSGLTTDQKKSVALAIFMEISLGFETMQSNWFYRNVAGTDSGFSAEDLVSNLLGFYKAIDPLLDIPRICGVVSEKGSLDVWDTHGPVGQFKNKTFQPLFFPSAECECGKPPKGLCKTGNHSFGNYRVTIGDDGKIVVKPGDWLSKYSAAMYQGVTTRVNEFGRLKGGKMEPIDNVNLILSGETIFHIPTYELSKNPQRAANDPAPWTGPLPIEFQQITPLTKGKEFRDWTLDDEITRSKQMQIIRDAQLQNARDAGKGI